MRRLFVAGLALLAAGCNCGNGKLPPVPPVASFQVIIDGVYLGRDPATRTPAPVVTPCADQYGGDLLVPSEKRGTKECPFAIDRGDISIDFTAHAIGTDGKPALNFGNTVSFYTVPGDATGDYPNRFAQAQNGIAQGTYITQHLYGQVRMWVADAPPTPIVDAGLVVPGLPVEPATRSYATGLSPTLFFEEPTLAKIQIPDGFDNRSSPFVGEFMTVGKNPESGEKLIQSCDSDPSRNGQPALMVVTGLDPSGFFVTDLSACRQVEQTIDSSGVLQVRTVMPPEACQGTLTDGTVVTAEAWDGGALSTPFQCQVSQGSCTKTTDCKSYLPGTFGAMFIYNYSFPDGLDTGDLLWTVSGSIQEFTSTTQMTFPAWSIAEKVRQLPPDQWNKWLQYAQPVELTERICGSDDVFQPFLTDQSCGHNKRNLKMESLESALVKIRNVKFPTAFTNCDFNNDGTVPFFCEQTDINTGKWFWGSCDFGSVEPPADAMERQCWQDCVWGVNQWTGQICSEESTFINFGQFVVEMDPAGAREFGYDESLPNRVQRFTANNAAATPANAYGPGVDLEFGCDAPAHVHFSNNGAGVTDQDPVLPANVTGTHTLVDPETSIVVLPQGAGADGGSAVAHCWVGQNFHYRINVMTRDAVPELKPDCSESDPDPDVATQCKALHAASFDIVGHLRQLQPSRPRWMVMPRDPDDVCCRPGPGLSCPKPIKPCNGSL